MIERQDELDDESRSLLAELCETPVGRRWLLKAGLASAVVVGGLGAARSEAKPAPKKPRRRTETTELHFVLGHVRGRSRLTLEANGQVIRLTRHTKASRAALRRRGGLWQVMDLSKLTHHVPVVKLPSDQAIVVSVYGHDGRRKVLVAQLLHSPRAATVRFARLSQRASGSLRHALPSARRLASLGLKPHDVRTAQQVADLATIGDSYQLAATVVGMHPNIATKDPTNAAITSQLLSTTGPVTDFGKYLLTFQKTKHFSQNVPAVNADGSPAMISIPIVQDGKVTGYQSTGFTTMQLNPDNDKTFAPVFQKAVVAGIRAVRDTASLGAVIDQPLDQDPAASTKTWVQPQGVIAQAQPLQARARAAAGFQPTVSNTGVLFGTQTVVNSGFTATQVPLTLYNNWVRWVWVYVQYLGAGNENLSANPNATFPDTKYSQSLGVLPQVFTILGVPLWNTNTISKTLNFPEGAHTARLLFCGLGSNLQDGSWRQYFPADAYLDANGNQKIAPQDEVEIASLITGILTIGLTAFALATDFSVGAAWDAIRDFTLDESVRSAEKLVLPAIEGVALGIAAGAETYDSIEANGGTGNIWSILLQIAAVIPKVIFNPAFFEGFWTNVAIALCGVLSFTKMISAFPVIGEVLAVLEVVGDVATLAEVCAESIVAPWVIENQVQLTYPATITVNRDMRDSTFPKTATSYQLTSKVDGALVFDPNTGVVNAGGVAQPGPLMLPVTAPFGGKLIQWSIVFLNARGVQVGTGVSAQFPNDDPANPASAVPITITELEVPIDSNTAFKRTVTTAYRSTPPTTAGYTWTNQIVDKGTVLSTGIGQVLSTSVSTLSGVAGVVWEQNNRFYIRGVPVGQAGATIPLGSATTEGYAKRPFLLLDPFVGRADQGNHVLLEPDPSTDAYHVRRVMLDATTGAPTWDPSASWGTFPLTVSAAALHASGRVVAVHTDSGRFSWLKPVNVDNPVLAAFTAGPGTQVGLLGSPIAIAVTNPGVALILEAAGASGPQLAAFDLNGNPVPYFNAPVTRRSLITPGRRRSASGQGQYTLTLINPAPTSTSPSTAPDRSTSSTTPAPAPTPAATTSTSTHQPEHYSTTTPSASTSRTSRSTTGAASTAPTTTHSSTSAPANHTSTPHSASPNHHSAASTPKNSSAAKHPNPNPSPNRASTLEQPHTPAPDPHRPTGPLCRGDCADVPGRRGDGARAARGRRWISIDLLDQSILDRTGEPRRQQSKPELHTSRGARRKFRTGSGDRRHAARLLEQYRRDDRARKRQRRQRRPKLHQHTGSRIPQQQQRVRGGGR
jgi:hypothetical protein